MSAKSNQAAPSNRRSWRGRLFERVIAPMLRLAASPMFDSKYLRGRHFDRSLSGWLALWQAIWNQRILRRNSHVPWPVSPAIAIDNPRMVIFDNDDMQNFWTHGCYFSNPYGGRITIGRGTLIAPNVGIITTNHRTDDPCLHQPPRDVVIGSDCWIGMNAVILPGVVLGPRTVVGAGAVVTKSFPEGHAVLVGMPAMPIASCAADG